ncbi:hypothetical protein NTGZN8_20016 [Candidatus Nitrotoga fabula]|uniref:Uncharacterized protein n=1 Tax=Candidatus Nitrotoga fabula TaxID=2182327 RepID=A0A916F8U7_9PROT|nr:hypothetical protein NTGZN8_20016 [Candidatus Nitrotoga fabula]
MALSLNAKVMFFTRDIYSFSHEAYPKAIQTMQ